MPNQDMELRHLAKADRHMIHAKNQIAIVSGILRAQRERGQDTGMSEKL